LEVGTTQGGNQIYPGSQVTNLTATVPGLPTNGSTVYVRLWSLISGTWQNNYNDYTYTAFSGGGGGFDQAFNGSGVAQLDSGFRKPGALAVAGTRRRGVPNLWAASTYNTGIRPRVRQNGGFRSGDSGYPASDKVSRAGGR
jgi:hypothetical protein